MSFPHRIEALTREQISDEDPFGGRGTRVQFETEMSPEQTADEVTKRYGDAPFVSWGTHAWVDNDGRRGQAPEDI